MKTKANKKKRRATGRPIKYDRSRFLRRLLEMMICALLSALVVEGFNQGSIPRLMDYLRGRTLYFGINFLLILATMSLSELFRHRRAMNISISALWCVLGIANYLVIRNRTMPLAGGDLMLDYQTVMLGMVYFSWFQIIGVFLAAVALIASIAWLFTHTARRRRINYAFGLCAIAMMSVLAFGSQMMCVKAGIMPETFPDRILAYRDYGFTTCFALTFGQHGIDKPDEYTPEVVEEILDEVDEVDTAAPQPTPVPAAQRFSAEEMENPNIVFLQLESFFDLDTMLDTKLSADPMPNFHALMQQWPNGALYVTTVGGGTANVEFEVMSGMNMEFFGAGETPYNSIIQEVPCETIANILGNRGYVSTALHNNTGTFFSRNQVYANLGYDRFDSLEYMLNPEYNPVGWARDTVLVDEIMRAMNSTPERDLIFSIGVESHGKYGETYTPAEGDIEVLAAPEEIFLEPFRNYVNLIRPVDAFLGDILAELEKWNEPVVAVIYGDHLPGVGLTPEMLENGDMYATQYIIWNNYGAEFEAPDLQAYRLSAELLRQLGISNGVITRFHQAYPVDEAGEEYMEKLQILEYDMLYGDQETYGEGGAPAPTALQMGIEPITLDSAVLQYGRLLVRGENFTEYSEIIAGEEVLETVFIDNATIAAYVPKGMEMEFPASICVAQLNNDGTELSRTAEMTVEIKKGTK